MIKTSRTIIKKYPKKTINTHVELFIETDKLHNIKRNIEKFLNKWTKKKLNELHFPQKFEKYRKSFITLQWVNRFALASAGILSLNGYQKIGGTISIFFPLVDLITLTLKDKSEVKKRRWEEFIKDLEGLSSNLDELINITNSIKKFSLEEISLFSEVLNEKIYTFLEKYDKNRDRVIDVHELEIEVFAHDLKINWAKGKEKKLKEIVWEIQNMQKRIINYRYHL